MGSKISPNIRTELIAEGHRIISEHSAFNRSNVRLYSKFPEGMYVNEFGNFTKARTEITGEIPGQYSREQLIEEARQIAANHEGKFTREIYDKATAFPRDAYRRVFGDIPAFRKAALGYAENQSPSKHAIPPSPDPRSLEKVAKSYQKGAAVIDVNSLTIHTLDGALETAEVDLDKWEVDRYTTNSWQVPMKIREEDGTDTPKLQTMYQVKVWLRAKITPLIEVSILRLAEDLAKAHIPLASKLPTPKLLRGSDSNVAMEIATVDPHIGKMAWGEETGSFDYDLPISLDWYLNVCENNLQRGAKFNPCQIFFVLGQDLLHAENLEGVTPTGGFVLDTDSRLPKIVAATLRAVIDAIYLCRQVAPVDVVWVPGNHDKHGSMYLGFAVQEHFRNDKHVTVDMSPERRKARLWGHTLVGWTHMITGKHNTWVNELAQRFHKEWGRSWFREWHYGHLHKKMEIKTFPIHTQGGVLLRQLTALSPIDAWHSEGGFTDAVPGGEMLLWHKDDGVFCNFTSWVHPPKVRQGAVT